MKDGLAETATCPSKIQAPHWSYGLVAEEQMLKQGPYFLNSLGIRWGHITSSPQWNASRNNVRGFFGIKRWGPFSIISSLPAGWVVMHRLTFEDLFWRWAVLNDFVKKITTHHTSPQATEQEHLHWTIVWIRDKFLLY